MKARYLLGIALAAATAVAACGGGATDTLTDGTGGDNDPTGGTAGSSGKPKPGGASSGGTTTNPDGTPVDPPGPNGPVATNSPAGKQYFKDNVHPAMQAKCGTCHIAGPGIVFWAADPEKAYAQLFQMGYVITNSRIVNKPAHGGVTTNVLSTVEIQTYNTWVAMELKDGGTKAPPAILEKIGNCFDKTKFDAMQLGTYRTTQRTNNNNTNNITPWNENANNCTGCNNAPCRTCHSADPATNYSNASGNNLLPANTTFDNTKLTAPAYITKYFGVSPDGKAIASDGLKKKSEATRKDKAYTHPMFTLNATQQAALDAFVLDAVTKFNAGDACGK